ncbi:MAG TPA: NlpC/P60 family protein [Streptosporangiaceae bacterium]|jgi:cell wall-associated NlpC family hydrolase
MARQIDGLALAAIGAGTGLAYAGIKGKSVLGELQSVVRGKSPAASRQVHAITTTAVTTAAGGGDVVSIALASQGHAYDFGGAPGTDFADPWDCSSAANSWAYQAGLPIPSEPPFNAGASHGPATVEWLIFTGLATVGSRAELAQAGDLCIWQTHMGLAIGGGQMISALNPQDGTQVTTIADAAPPLEVLFVRRWRASDGST